MINPLPGQMYRILACPKCKSDVKYASNKTELRCVKCHKVYEIRDGIPIMLVD